MQGACPALKPLATIPMPLICGKQRHTITLSCPDPQEGMPAPWQANSHLQKPKS
jgi:hypothetical protein